MKRAWLLALCACGAPARTSPVPPAKPRPAPWIDLRLGDPTWHVPGSVDAIAWTKDERRLVIGSNDVGVLVYDVATGAASARIEDAGDAIAYLSPIDDRLVLVSGNGFRDDGDDESLVHAVDLAAHTVAPTALHAHAALVVPGDPGAALLEPIDPQRPLSIVDRATGAVRRELPHSRGYGIVQVVPGRAVAELNSTAEIWDLATGARVARFAAPGLAALSPDGATIATGPFGNGVGAEIDLYRIADGAKIATLSSDCSPRLLRYSPDGARIAAACEAGVRVWDAATGTLVETIAEPLDYVEALAFSPSGRWLAAGGNDDVVHLWDTASWSEREIGDAQRGQVSSMQVSADGRHLLTDSFVDGTARVWDLASGRAQVIAGPAGITAAGFDGNAVLVAGSDDQDGVVARWPAGARAAAQTARVHGRFTPTIRGLAGRSDGEVIAIYDGAVHVLDEQLAARWTSHKEDAEDLGNGPVAITADGARAVIAEGAGLTIVDVRARTATALHQALCGGATAVAWSPDGARVAFGTTDRSITLLDAAADSRIAAIRLPDDASAIAVARDGHVIALAGDHVYDLAPGGALVRVPAPDASAMAISPDGASIYLGRTDGTIARISRAAAAAAGVVEPFAGERVSDDDECPGTGGTGYGFGRSGSGGPPPRGKLPDDAPDPGDAH